jgi:dynein heavy chain
VSKFKGKAHRLLEYKDDRFDRDFVEFNVDISNVETQLQEYINENFANITNIVDSLRLLRKFESILHRNSLKNGLQAKYNLLFAQYGTEIEKIKNDYQRDKERPPIVRNLPPVAGAITWSRHLFYRISVPMEQFPQDLVRQRTSNIRQHVKNHNALGYTLFSYEYMWRKEWQKEVDRAKAGL